MKALLLAAGSSTRLYPLTRNLPKCLLPLGDRLLIDFLWSTLEMLGVHEKIVVTGFHREQIEQHLEGKARFIHNPEYAWTNNLTSFRVALDAGVHGPLLCLHADLLLDPGILKRSMEAPGAVVLTADRELVSETMKVAIRPDHSLAIGKSLPQDQLIGTFLGVAKLEAAVVEELRRSIGHMDEDQFRSAYFTAALQPWLQTGSIQVAWTDGLPWIEIDTPDDLDRARREVLPKIQLGNRSTR